MHFKPNSPKLAAMSGIDFEFDPPLFVLAEREDFEGYQIGERPIRFLSRSVGGKDMALVFTDEDLAASFRESLPANDLAVVKFMTLEDFRGFVRSAVRSKHESVVFDMNPKTQRGLVMPARPLLAQIDGQ